MRKFKTSIFIFSAAIILLNPAASFACPGCNAAVTDQLGRAFNPSVLFMMAMPFAVVGAIAGGLFYTYWHAQNKANRKEIDMDESSSQENK